MSVETLNSRRLGTIYPRYNEALGGYHVIVALYGDYRYIKLGFQD